MSKQKKDIKPFELPMPKSMRKVTYHPITVVFQDHNHQALNRNRICHYTTDNLGSNKLQNFVDSLKKVYTEVKYLGHKNGEEQVIVVLAENQDLSESFDKVGLYDLNSYLNK